MENSSPDTPIVETVKPLVQPLDVTDQPSSSATPKSTAKYLVFIAVIVILLGSGSGYLLNINFPQKADTDTATTLTGTKVIKDSSGQISEEGLKDQTLFPDKAQGELQKNDGKLTQEGSHILVRPGGAAQTVYLTSSAVDMDQFVGKQVEVWGQTNTAQKAGWLMEVGYIKIN